MRLIRLLLLGAGAAYAYKRFVADSGAGLAETQAAEPFSSDQLADDGGQPAAEAEGSGASTEPDTGAAPEADAEPEAGKDTLEQPTWLKPADADGGGSAATAGDGS